MRREYGDEVEVKVVDLSDWDQRLEHEELVKTIESLNWPFPVVAIDGSSKLVRGLKFGEISKYINEIKAGTAAG